jgi:hypothetical protein
MHRNNFSFNWASRHEGVLGEWRYSSTHSLTSALDGGEWSASRPGCFTPREKAPGTHWIGGWVGSRTVLDAVGKRRIPSPRQESNPRTPIVQPVGQRFTDWAIAAVTLLLLYITCWSNHCKKCVWWDGSGWDHRSLVLRFLFVWTRQSTLGLHERRENVFVCTMSDRLLHGISWICLVCWHLVLVDRMIDSCHNFWKSLHLLSKGWYSTFSRVSETETNVALYYRE